jgi:hypothetical protein
LFGLFYVDFIKRHANTELHYQVVVGIGRNSALRNIELPFSPQLFDKLRSVTCDVRPNLHDTVQSTTLEFDQKRQTIREDQKRPSFTFRTPDAHPRHFRIGGQVRSPPPEVARSDPGCLAAGDDAPSDHPLSTNFDVGRVSRPDVSVCHIDPPVLIWSTLRVLETCYDSPLSTLADPSGSLFVPGFH